MSVAKFVNLLQDGTTDMDSSFLSELFTFFLTSKQLTNACPQNWFGFYFIWGDYCKSFKFHYYLCDHIRCK